MGFLCCDLLAEVGRILLDLMAWFRAYLEKRPSPVGSEGFMIMLILLLVIFLNSAGQIYISNLNPTPKTSSCHSQSPARFMNIYFDIIIMSLSAKQNDLVFKVIVVGDSGCGKSCLVQRYLTNEFVDDYTVTLGVEYHSKSVKIDGHISIKLQFWDTAGQEAFHSLVKAFYRNAHAVVLVYDITRRQTFQSLDLWQQQALENSPQDAIYILIGTHLDLAGSREVETKEAEDWIKQAGVEMYFQTSAKTAQNVARAFEEVCKQLLLLNMRKTEDREKGFKLKDEEKESSFCC